MGIRVSYWHHHGRNRSLNHDGRSEVEKEGREVFREGRARSDQDDEVEILEVVEVEVAYPRVFQACLHQSEAGKADEEGRVGLFVGRGRALAVEVEAGIQVGP